MKESLCTFSHSFVRIGIFVVLVAGDSFAQAETNSVAAMDKAFVFVTTDLCCLICISAFPGP
jgi:hypothetical protein